MKRDIRGKIQEVLKNLYPPHADIDFSVEYAPDNIDADFASNVAMILAKKLGKNPMEVAEELVNNLQPTTYNLQASKPGFVNFKLSREELLANLNDILGQKEQYGQSAVKSDESILVEYFQPNIAKPLHVGHMRSAVIGDCLYRLAGLFAKKVESDTHMGDWGTQFGIMLLAYKTLDGQARVLSDPVNELNALYVEMNAKIEKDEALLEQAKREFVLLEKGDKENRGLWKKFVDWSIAEFATAAELLRFRPADHDWPESFYEDKMPAVIDLLKEKGLLTESKGARVVDLEPHKLGTAIIVKSDGGTTYLLRDLATFLFRAREQGFKRQLYVVDTRQSHHFQQMFRILELLGQSREGSEHIQFGFMKLPGGALSTRKGNVVNLKEFVDEAVKRATAVINEKNPELKDKSTTAKAVALGAIKYADLKNNRKSDIVFNWDEAFNFEGNSGPYLQYTHARFRSILRKGKDVIASDSSSVIATPHLMRGKQSHGTATADQDRPRSDGAARNDSEHKLLRKLAIYPDILADAYRELMPHILAGYLYELAGAANGFYHEVPVLKADMDQERQFRLALVAASAAVLKNGLNLLGIEAPEEM